MFPWRRHAIIIITGISFYLITVFLFLILCIPMMGFLLVSGQKLTPLISIDVLDVFSLLEFESKYSDKSNVYGVGVDNFVVERLTSILKCEPPSFPFTYLGVPVGANMKLVKNWNTVVDKFKKKISMWKVRSLSSGGRLTLVNLILNNLPLYYFSMFCAPRKVINIILIQI